MTRAFCALLLCASPLVAQGFSLPFALTGGPLHIDGTLTSGPPVVCSGTASITGASGSIGPCKAHHTSGGVCWYRMQVLLEEDIYVIWISVNPNAPIGHQVGGYWYITGTHGTTYF